jgi:hypothetical protein
MLHRDDIIAAVRAALAEHSSPEHDEEHAWIRERIQAEKHRKEFWKDCNRILLEWSLVGVVSYVAMHVTDVMSWFKK